MQYYNMHSHDFTMSNAPKRFLHLYLPDFVADAVDKITNTSVGSKIIEKLLTTLGGNGGRRYASFLTIGKSANQLQVFENLRKQYDDINMKFVGLTMNMEFCGAGESVSGFEGQIEEILNVKRQYPDQLLLFLGIDPRWKATGKELRDTVEKYFTTRLKVNATTAVFPFCGLKIYPSMGFYPFDERLKETYEWAAEHGVPVLSHCNYQGGIYNNDTDFIKSHLDCFDPFLPAGTIDKMYHGQYVNNRNLGKWLLGTQASGNNLNTCSYFMEPYAFTSIMEYFKDRPKPLKLCLAHFGGGEQLLAAGNGKVPYGNGKMNWFTQIQEMMQKYDSLYTDISYALHDKKTFPVIFNELNQVKYGNRILYGTDYFLTEREQAEKLTYMNFKLAAQQVRSGNFDNITAWDQVASSNITGFLSSDFYQAQEPGQGAGVAAG